MTVIESVRASAAAMQARLDMIEDHLDASRALLREQAPAAYHDARRRLSAAQAEFMQMALASPANAPAARLLRRVCDEIAGSLLAAAILQDSGGSLRASSRILARTAERISSRLQSI